MTKNDSSSSDTDDGGSGTEDNDSSGSNDVILVDSDDDVTTWKKRKKGKLPKVTLGSKSVEIKEEKDEKPNVHDLNKAFNQEDERMSLTISQVVSQSDDTPSQDNSQDQQPMESVNEKTGQESEKSTNKSQTSDKSKTVLSENADSAKNKHKDSNACKDTGDVNSVSGRSPSVTGKSKECEKTNDSNGIVSPPSPCVHKYVQTNDGLGAEKRLKKELEESKKHLSSLRGDVLNLLKVLVPDLSIDNPSDVDRYVVEIYKANKSAEEEEAKKDNKSSEKPNSTAVSQGVEIKDDL